MRMLFYEGSLISGTWITGKKNILSLEGAKIRDKKKVGKFSIIQNNNK